MGKSRAAVTPGDAFQILGRPLALLRGGGHVNVALQTLTGGHDRAEGGGRETALVRLPRGTVKRGGARRTVYLGAEEERLLRELRQAWERRHGRAISYSGAVRLALRLAAAAWTPR